MLLAFARVLVQFVGPLAFGFWLLALISIPQHADHTPAAPQATAIMVVGFTVMEYFLERFTFWDIPTPHRSPKPVLTYVSFLGRG